MIAANAHRTLGHRLSVQNLIFGLSGLLVFVVTAICLSWQNVFLQAIAAAVGVPLALVLSGSFAVRRISKWHEKIEMQLIALSKRSGQGIMELQQLPLNEPLAHGWNQLVIMLKENNAWNGVERRLSETTYAQQANSLEAVFESQSDGIAVCDAEGRITQLNRAFATLLKQSDRQSLMGQELVSIFESMIDDDSRIKLDTVFLGNANQVIELRCSADLAQGAWRLGRATPTQDGLQPGDSIWTLRDITQQKLAEQAREQFVFTATHELRTPLANIRAYTETLSSMSDIPVDKQRAFYNTIHSEVMRLGRFVDELLNISQMEAGAINVNRHEVQLDRLLNEVIDGQRPLAFEKSQTFELHASPKLPKLAADKEKLAAALANLIGNAIKYTPDGGKIVVRAIAEEDRVLIHVEDSGFGISAEDIPKLCKKFFRSDDSRVQAIVGTGLGLAFSQEVARLHGGNLSIRSQINQGSCFSLELPIR